MHKATGLQYRQTMIRLIRIRCGARVSNPHTRRGDGEYGYSNPFRIRYLRLLVPVVMASYANRHKTFHEELHSASTGGTYPGRTTVQDTSMNHGRRTSLWPKSSWTVRKCSYNRQDYNSGKFRRKVAFLNWRCIRFCVSVWKEGTPRFEATGSGLELSVFFGQRSSRRG